MTDDVLGYDEYLLDPLDTLLNEIFHQEPEETMLRLVALHQVQAEAASRPNLTPADHMAFGLLISRWSMALADREHDLGALDGGWEISTPTFARLLNVDLRDFEQNLQALSDARLITLRLGAGEATVTLAPAFASASNRLVPLLYREIVDRHGAHLRWLASEMVESLREDLSKQSPATGTTRQLESDLQALLTKTSVVELEQRWRETPAAVYDWLEALGQIEERAALAGVTIGMDVRRYLSNAADMKVMILRGKLNPPPAPANAA